MLTNGEKSRAFLILSNHLKLIHDGFGLVVCLRQIPNFDN
jgi:hypothetical protein